MTTEPLLNTLKTRSSNRQKSVTTAVLLLIASAMVPAAGATTLLSEDFSSGINNWTLISGGSGSSMTWNSASTGFGTSMVYQSSASQHSTNHGKMYVEITPQTLHAGDILSATITFKGLEYIANNSNFFGMGFINESWLGHATINRADSRETAIGVEAFVPYDGPDSLIGHTGPAPYSGTASSGGSLFAFTNANISDIMHITFSIEALGGENYMLRSTYLNTATSATFSNEVQIASELDTFSAFVIGYQRSGNNGRGSFEIGSVDIGVIPEPRFYGALMSLLAMGAVIWRGRAHA